MKKALLALLVIAVSVTYCKSKKYPYKITGMMYGKKSVLYTDSYTILNDTLRSINSDSSVFIVTEPYKIEREK